MEANKLFFYLFFLSLHYIASSADCTTSYCGQSVIEARFPFRLINQQPENCGYAGFDLRCAFPSTLLINLPGSGEFSVRSINYHAPAIRVYDPLNCLAARLLTLDLSNTPFSASYFQNFTLLSCPSDATTLSGFKPIGCLSNSSVSVFATNGVTSMTSNETGCVTSGYLVVPVDQPYDDGFSTISELDEDITLTWSKPNCAKCERVGDTCGYANSNTKRTKCFSNLAAPKPSGIFRIIAFALAIPCMTASVVIACFMCNKDRRNQLINRRTTNTAVNPEDANPSPTINVGLDQATIESYTKVVLGESKRLPGHDEATCPICLCEYHVKEMVRCIPECQHCYHAECIDEWLKMNGTCPVCRNSPPPVHAES